MKYFPRIMASIVFPLICLALIGQLYEIQDATRDKIVFGWIGFCLYALGYFGEKELSRWLDE